MLTEAKQLSFQPCLWVTPHPGLQLTLQKSQNSSGSEAWQNLSPTPVLAHRGQVTPSGHMVGLWLYGPSAATTLT